MFPTATVHRLILTHVGRFLCVHAFLLGMLCHAWLTCRASSVEVHNLEDCSGGSAVGKAVGIGGHNIGGGHRIASVHLRWRG